MEKFKLEQTLVLLKPDAIQRLLIGEIISRIESKGLKIVATKLTVLDKNTANQHYGEHSEKPFFNDLVNFITSGPILAMVLEGKNAISITRSMMGETNPATANPGTIRGDLATTMTYNLIHGSDSLKSAIKEISLFFKKDELISYNRTIENWIQD